MEKNLGQNQTTLWVVAMAAVGHTHVPSTLMSLRCRFTDDTVLMLRCSHLMAATVRYIALIVTSVSPAS